MRIVIDLQGAQTESRFRGIGRYSLSFVRALLSQRSQHDFWVVLNGRFGESIGEIEEALNCLLESISVDRNWNEEAARKQLVEFFSAIGLQDPIVVRARKRLSSILFS
mgnify:CR=1 FL=1